MLPTTDMNRETKSKLYRVYYTWILRKDLVFLLESPVKTDTEIIRSRNQIKMFYFLNLRFHWFL